MKRLAVMAAAGLALFASGAALGWFAHRPTLSAALYAQNRLLAIQQHLDEAEPGYVLLAGDSQVELQTPSERICDGPIVNAGIMGASSADYARLLATLSFPVPPRAAVLTIGTNDLRPKNDPLSAAALDEFERSVALMVRQLKTFSERIVVTALPPLGGEQGGMFDPSAIGVYSARIGALCERLGCRYADPFVSLRDGLSGVGLPGAISASHHLTHYRPVLRDLASAVCSDEPVRGPMRTKGSG